MTPVVSQAEPRAVGSPAPGRDAPGQFITFEGLEGSGKSTQIGRLAARLRGSGKNVVATREPGGTEIGRQLRSLLLHPDVGPMAVMCELLLYLADRAQHLEEIVAPALQLGSVVLCDRYVDATLAYQGHGRRLGVELIRELHRHPPLDRVPDRTILLDLDEGVALTRARERDHHSGIAASEGRFEMEQLAFHRRVRQGYLELAQGMPGRIRLIDAAGELATVERRVQDALRDLLPV